MQPIASGRQRSAESGAMEYRTAVPGIDPRAHRQGPATACDGRDPRARPGRGPMHTEHPGRRDPHQELRRIEHDPA